MSPQHHFKLTQLAAMLAAAYVVFPATGYCVAAGHVDFVAGDVMTAGTDGVQHPLVKGADINAGDEIDTAPGGRAQIRFSDGAYVSLQPNSQFRVDDYNYENKTDGSEKGFFSLLKGGLRAISGAIGHVNRDKYRVTTPTATIGIRGTGYNVALSDGLTVNVTDGKVSLTNAGGSLVISQGQSAFVANANTAPVLTFEKPSTPPASISKSADQPVEKSTTPIATDTGSSSVNSSNITVVTGLVDVAAGSHPGGGGSQLDSPEFPAIAILDGRGSISFHTSPTGELADFTAATLDNGVYNGIPASGFDGIIGWERFYGTSTFTHTDGSVTADSLTADQGFHAVFGTPTPLMPTSGSAHYDLLGATRPTLDSGAVAPGTVTGGGLNVFFGSQPSLSGTLDIAIAGTTVGLSFFSSFSGNTFNGSGSATGTGCLSSCSANVSGFFAGAGAARAGVAYQILNTTFGAGSALSGAAVYTKTASPVPLL